jgi:soluble epoxide hydrolase / lipid-phosphate phosphatase
VSEADFIDSKVKNTLISRWRADGFDGKLGWYCAMTENINWENEQKLAITAFRLLVPVLFIRGTRDATAPAALGELVTKGLCKDYTGVVIDSYH